MTSDEDTEMMVNPFGKENKEPFEQKAQKVEEVSSLEDELVKKAFEMYDPNKDSRKAAIALTPEQIDTLLIRIRECYDKHALRNTITGRFFSRLISASHMISGYDRFTLTTGDDMIDDLPLLLDMSVLHPPLYFNINGNCGEYAGGHLIRCYVTLEGTADEMFGAKSEESSYIVKGDTGQHCGFSAKHGSFTIHGNTGDALGSHSEDSTFKVYGDIGPYPLSCARRCILKTLNEANYEKAISEVQGRGDNTVQLLDSKGDVVREEKR